MTKYTISDEDKALFRRAAGATKPIKQRKTVKTKQRTPIEPRVNRVSKPIKKPPVFLSDFHQDTVQAEDILSYKRPDLSQKHFHQLKSSKLRIEAVLDLHGQTIDEARNHLCDFLQIQQKQHARCVLIVHGKGGYHGLPPVIKNHTNTWLKQHPAVVAFHSALPRHGGTGAVYVALKKLTMT